MIHIRTVNRGMTATGPTRSQDNTTTVIHIADEQASTRALPLRVTLDAQVGVTIDEQLLIDGAVW